MSIATPTLSLLELSEQVKKQVKLVFSDTVWVRAEISALHENYSGHGYFELVEKEETSDSIVAKTKANCWASTFRMLKPYFESATGEQLKAGLKVLVSCTVEYHELYGISLNIRDIDPSYTLGDMARRRLEIIRRLQEDGVFDMNKQVVLSHTPQRVAIISSSTAAGYGDFLDQLMHNAEGYPFYTKLFPAVMQGEQTVDSVIAALDKIYAHQEKFDVVVIIRGGGATADLSSFDNYDLAFNCTQFPLPIITGIGHQRDESILDLVAHTKAKTPTAVAEFLVVSMDETYEQLEHIQYAIINSTQHKIQQENQQLQQLSIQIPQLVNEILFKQKNMLNLAEQQLKNAIQSILVKKENSLLLLEKEVLFSSPEVLLKRGYSLTLKAGKLVKSKKQLKQGDEITTRLEDGDLQSIIK